MNKPIGLLKRHWQAVRVAVWTLVGLFTVSAVILYPTIAERVLSSDGQLAPAARRMLFVIEAVLLVTAGLIAMASRRLRQHTPRNERLVLGTVFGVCSIAVSLFLCEVGLRAASGFRPLRADRHFFFLHDELLGWRHRPGAVALFKNAVVRINSAGLRDDELPNPGSSDGPRVLFLGDSQVFGDGVASDDTFVQRLEREFRSLQAINAGVIGYGTDQQVLYFEQEGHRFGARTTVVGLNAYDLRDNISTRVRSGYIKPRFELAAGRLQLANVPISKGSVIDRAQRELRTRSHLYTLINQRWDGEVESRSDGQRDLTEQVFPPDGQMEKALDVTVALLSRLASAIRARDARLAVVFLPYDMDFTGDRRYAERVDRLVQTLEHAGRDCGFVVFDLRPYLKDGRGLFIDRMHFNPEGHRRVAAILKSLLAESAFIRASHAN